MASAKDNFIKSALGVKKRTERGLQSVGKQLRANFDQGQRDFKSGKMKYYGSINPLKGALDAYKRGYGG